MRRFRADCIVVTPERFIRDGTLVVDEGVVRDVERARPASVDREFKGKVIVPGLVNAHTHFDLSLAPPSVRASHQGNFFAWLREIVEYRRRASLEELIEAVRAGVRESIRFGTVAVGDITTIGLPPAAWHPLRGVIFGELLGTGSDRIEPLKQQATRWLTAAEAAAQRRGRIQVSLSPHAPYTTASTLYRWAARQCPSIPLSTHLLELPDEAAILENPAAADNSLVEILKNYGVWRPEELWPRAELFRFLGSTPATWILAHCNYATAAELHPIASRVCVAYCPRTHAAFGHARHPCRTLSEAGIPVVLATDSKATAPNLSLLAEARAALVRDRLEPTEALRMVTQLPAAALGLKHNGTLVPGSHADFVVIAPRGPVDDPLRALFDPGARVVATFIAGEAVFDAELR